MSDKTRWVTITDPTEADELTKDPSDLSMPFTLKPNGHLWVLADELQTWRNGRDQQNRMD